MVHVCCDAIRRQRRGQSKESVVKTSSKLILAAFVGFVCFGTWAGQAQAGPCTSACERVRRACLFENKLTFDGEKVRCLEEQFQCGIDCEAAFSGGARKACKRECRSTSLACRDQAFVDVVNGRVACDETDAACTAECESIDDRRCLRSCTRPLVSCTKAVKEAKEACFSACRHAVVKPKGCKISCREATVEGNLGCTTEMFGCFGECLN